MSTSTIAHLANLGVTVEQAREFLIRNINQPELIFNVSMSYGITNSMLGEIIGIDVSIVRGFWTSVGLNSRGLDSFDASLPTQYQTLRGNVFEIVLGTSLSDSFHHSSGNKIYFGLGGDDSFKNTSFSSGISIFIGGSGNDRFEIYPASGWIYFGDAGGGQDTVVDHTEGIADKVYLLAQEHTMTYLRGPYPGGESVIIQLWRGDTDGYIETFVDPLSGTTSSGDEQWDRIKKSAIYQGEISYDDLGIISGPSIQKAIADVSSIHEQYVQAGY